MSPKPKQGRFMPQIEAYDGDPSKLKFFISHILDIQKVNQWPDSKTLLFLKSKITGAARTFFVQRHELQDKSLQKVLDKFTEFFLHKGPTNSIIDLHNLHLILGEFICNLAHRLGNTAHSVSSLKDKDALDHIKLQHFLQALPKHIKTKILELDIKQYQAAVAKAQQILTTAQGDSSSTPAIH